MVNEHILSLVRSAVAASEARPCNLPYSYHAISDTMMLHFSGSSSPATSVLIDDPFDAVYIRMDQDRNVAVGLHIEGFAIDFVYRHPEMAEALLIPDLGGVTRNKAAAIVERARDRGPRPPTVTTYPKHLIAG
jgi:predicted protein tyrosine phosphatase